MLHLRTVRVGRFFLATFSMSLTPTFTFIWILQKKSTKLTFMASIVLENSYKCATCSLLFCNFNCRYLNNMETSKLRFTYKNNVAYIGTFWLHQFKWEIYKPYLNTLFSNKPFWREYTCNHTNLFLRLGTLSWVNENPLYTIFFFLVPHHRHSSYFKSLKASTMCTKNEILFVSEKSRCLSYKNVLTHFTTLIFALPLPILSHVW